jgi:hypothetical protein
MVCTSNGNINDLEIIFFFKSPSELTFWITYVLRAHFNYGVTVILLKSCNAQPADPHAWLFTVVQCVANKS